MGHDSSQTKKYTSAAKFLKSFDLGNPQQTDSPLRANRPSLHQQALGSRKGSQAQSASRKSLGSGLKASSPNTKSKTKLENKHLGGSNLFGASLFDRDEVTKKSIKIGKNNLSANEHTKSMLRMRRSVELVDYSRPDKEVDSQNSNTIRTSSRFPLHLDPVDKALFGDRKSCNSLIQTTKGLASDHGTLQLKGYSKGDPNKLEGQATKPSTSMSIQKGLGRAHYRSVEFLPSGQSKELSKKPDQSAYDRLSSKVSEICKESGYFGAVGQNGGYISYMLPSKSRVGLNSKKPGTAGGLQKKVSPTKTQTEAGPVRAMKGVTVSTAVGNLQSVASTGNSRIPGSGLTKKSLAHSGISTPNNAKANPKKSIEPKPATSSYLHTKITKKPLTDELLSGKNTLNSLFKKNPVQTPTVPKYKHKSIKNNASPAKKPIGTSKKLEDEVVKLSMVSIVQTKIGNSRLMSQTILPEETKAPSGNRVIPKTLGNLTALSKEPVTMLGQPGLLSVPISREADVLGDTTDKSRSKLSLKSRSDVGLKLPETVSLQKLKVVGSQSPTAKTTSKVVVDSKRTIRSKLEEYSHQPSSGQVLKRSQTELLELSSENPAAIKPDIIIKRPSERSLGSIGSQKGRIIFHAQQSLQIDHQLDSPKSVPNGIKSVGKLSLSKFYNRADSYSLAQSNGMSDSKSLKREFKKQMQEEFQEDTSIASKGLILGKILGRGRFGIVRLIVDPAKQNKALVLKCYNKLTLVSANALSSVEVDFTYAE